METKHSIIFADDLWGLINSCQIEIPYSPVRSGITLLEAIFNGFPLKPIVALNSMALRCDDGLLAISQDLTGKFSPVFGFDPIDCSFSLYGKGIPIVDVYDMCKRIPFTSPNAAHPNVQKLHDALRKTKIHFVEICCDETDPQIDKLINHLKGF